jgi:arsenate reductase
VADRAFNVLFLCTGNTARSILAEAFGYPTDGLRSKSWDEFVAPGAPKMDFVFTVCDSAAGEACPIWPGSPITAHWGIEDPAAVAGSDIDKLRAFNDAFRFLRNRIQTFVALPIASLEHLALKRRLQEIGGQEGATIVPRELRA